MAVARRLTTLGRAARAEAGVKVRQPLARALVFLPAGSPRPPTGAVELGSDDLELRVRSQEGFAVSREGGEVVALDLSLDESLIRRGLIRDVIRQIQELRKSTGLELADRIELDVDGLDDLDDDDLAVIGSEVLAVAVRRGSSDGDGHLLDLEERQNALVWIRPVVA